MEDKSHNLKPSPHTRLGLGCVLFRPARPDNRGFEPDAASFGGNFAGIGAERRRGVEHVDLALDVIIHW